MFTATPGSHGERHGFIETVDGVRVHRMALRLPWELPVNPLAPPEVRRRLADGGFDVAHVHMGVVSPFATDMADVALGARPADGHHLALPHRALEAAVPPHGPRTSVGVAAGAALSAVSGVAADAVRSVVRGAEVGVLPNGIDVGLWAPPGPREPEPTEPDRAGTEPTAPVRVLAAMRLAARKRPIAVLEVAAAARELLPADVRFTVELMGEGPERRRLEQFAGGAPHGVLAAPAGPGVPRRAATALLGQRRLPHPGAAGGVRHRRPRGADRQACPSSPAPAPASASSSRTASTACSPRTTRPSRGAWPSSSSTTPLRARIARHNATTPPSQSWPEVVATAVEGVRPREVRAVTTAGPPHPTPLRARGGRRCPRRAGGRRSRSATARTRSGCCASSAGSPRASGDRHGRGP